MRSLFNLLSRVWPVVGCAVFSMNLLLFATASVAGTLSGRELRNLVVGNTLLAETRNGAPWRLFASSDGTVTFHFASGLLQRGRYSFAGNSVCFQLPDVDQDCRILRSTGGNYLEWTAAQRPQLGSSYILSKAEGDYFALSSLQSGKFFRSLQYTTPTTLMPLRIQVRTGSRSIVDEIFLKLSG